jgi:osmoprotectant transport system permease protein
MSRLQLLFLVEVPRALPIILSGLRIACVQNVGNTAVAALIGAGGLGVFIFQGLGQSALDLIMLGAVPTILLAVGVDALFQLLIRLVSPGGL